jgi:Protein of unknown function (DUF2844)
MTSISLLVRALALAGAVLCGMPAAHAGLGEAESSVESDRLNFSAQRMLRHQLGYRVHVLETPQGARVQQYVGAQGRVFAVSWRAGFKPDLSRLLGSSAPEVERSMNEAVRKGGLQRQFHHQQSDLVVQASAYLNQHRGIAYRPSLLPAGFDLSSLGRN